MLQDQHALSGCSCVQEEAQSREGKNKRKEKDVETARDGNESGEVCVAGPGFPLC